MILRALSDTYRQLCKPRASGDDPDVAAVHGQSQR
mgnify:CR=1 FL=1